MAHSLTTPVPIRARTMILQPRLCGRRISMAAEDTTITQACRQDRDPRGSFQPVLDPIELIWVLDIAVTAI